METCASSAGMPLVAGGGMTSGGIGCRLRAARRAGDGWGRWWRTGAQQHRCTDVLEDFVRV